MGNCSKGKELYPDYGFLTLLFERVGIDVIYLDSNDKRSLLRVLDCERSRLEHKLEIYDGHDYSRGELAGRIWYKSVHADYCNICDLISRFKKEPASNELAEQFSFFDV